MKRNAKQSKASSTSRKGKSKRPAQVSHSPQVRAKAAPVAIGYTTRASPPAFTSRSGDGLIVSRREFVGSISNGSTTGFSFDQYSTLTPGWDFNPGATLMFPWLSGIASSYERYRFETLEFELVPSQATTTAGRIYMAVDYDYDDAVATSKLVLMGNKTAVECPVWEHLRIRCDPKELNRDQPFKYVNTGGRLVAPEPRTCYSGFLMIAFDTPTANCTWDLWVTYRVAFTAPINDKLQAVTTTSPSDTVSTPSWVAGAQYAYHTLARTASTLLQFPGIGEVLAGTNGVPTMTVEGITNPAVLDLARVAPKAILSVMGKAAQTGTAPANRDPIAAADIHFVDAAGQFVKKGYDLITGTAAEKATVASRQSGQNLLTTNNAGDPAWTGASFKMDVLRALYPTIRYAVPLMRATLAGYATTATTLGWSVTQ